MVAQSTATDTWIFGSSPPLLSTFFFPSPQGSFPNMTFIFLPLDSLYSASGAEGSLPMVYVFFLLVPHFLFLFRHEKPSLRAFLVLYPQVQGM